MTLETEPIAPIGSSGHWRVALRRPGFPAYVVAAGATSAGFNISMVIFAWVALVVTTDPLAVGLVFAVRFLMLLLLGIPAGVLADRVDRRRMLQASSLGSAAIALALAVLAAASDDTLPLWALVVGSVALGALDATRVAAAAAYAFDLVGPSLATTGLALGNLAALGAAVLGSIAGGYALDHMGLVAAFLVLALIQVGAAAALVPGAPPRSRSSASPKAAGGGLRESLTLLQRDRMVRLLASVVIVVEVFGFSCATLLPVFTREVFDMGPDAYGTLNAVRSAGGVAALLVVIRFGPRAGTGLALLGASLLFGVALVLFAVSPSVAVAAVPIVLVGAAGAATDSLSQTLLQHAVTDAERGAAMGVWAFGLGFGPLGYVVAGAMAGRYGPVPTQVLFGLALAGLSLLLLTRPRLRALR